MNIALFGYGKMGKEVERVAIARGHEIAGRFDVGDPLDANALRNASIDVAIDFTEASAVPSHVKAAAEAGIAIVIGTTGWEPQLENIKKHVAEFKIGCMIGSNFSVGVNLFLDIVRIASRELDAAGYDAYVLEAHHNMKKDFPSGTALRLGEAVLEGMRTKSKMISRLPDGEAIPSDALLISSIRAGTIAGKHIVGFDSDEDSIEFIHTAKSRKGFASGAVRAAEWIEHKTGFFRFEEVIGDVLGSAS